MNSKVAYALVFFFSGFVTALFLEHTQRPDIKTQREPNAVFSCKQFTPSGLVIKMIDDDFNDLRINGQLPVEWSLISKVKIHNNSIFGRALLAKDGPHFQVNMNGTKYLEIEIIDLPDESNPGIILQASLFDLYSNNKIFEIGRTYFLSNSEMK